MYAPFDEYVPQSVPQGAKRTPLLVWAALAAFTLCFVGLTVAAPLLLAHGYAGASGAIYHGFSLLCHQLPERSFHLEGHAMGVCSRCAGIYAGFAVSVLLYPLVRGLRSVETPHRLWLVWASLPIATDFALGLFGIWQNTHFSRFITGAIFGAVCALFIVPGFLDLARAVRQGMRAAAMKWIE